MSNPNQYYLSWYNPYTMGLQFSHPRSFGEALANIFTLLNQGFKHVRMHKVN